MNTLAGTGGMIRLILRRDRLLLPLWIVIPALLAVVTAVSFEELYPTGPEREQAAAQIRGNPAFSMLFGPLFDSSLGGLVAWRTGFLPLVLGLISLLAVIRHTRTEEEAGRRELLGSTVLGRHAPLAAALSVTLAANAAFAILLGLGLTAQGQPAAGAFALGLAFASAGWVFAAVAGVAAQLTAGAGAARGFALSALGLAFLLRVVGDVSGADRGLSFLSWLSPIGWAHRARAFGGERWWVLGLSVALTALLVAPAALLTVRRDIGAGLLPPRLGPAAGSPLLRSPLALAWRLHRGLIVAWTAGLAVIGAFYGGAATGIVDLFEDNPELREVFERLGGDGAVLVDIFLSVAMGLLGMIAAGYAVQAALRMRAEETALRAEPVLATGVSRLRWAGSHVAFVVIGPALALAMAGLTTGIAYGIAVGDMGQIPRMVGAALVQLPGVWVLAGVALAVFGLLPWMMALAWGAFGLVVLITQFGPILRLDQWALNVSPFTHVPALPGTELILLPLVWLAGVAGVLAATGLGGLRRRDIG